MKKHVISWQFVKRQGPYSSIAAGETEEQAKENFLSGFTAEERRCVEIDRVDLDTPKLSVETEKDAV